MDNKDALSRLFSTAGLCCGGMKFINWKKRRNHVKCKEIIWKTNVYEFRRKVNNAAGYAACDTTNAQGGAVCLDAVCLDGKQGISTAWEILDCSDLVTAL